MRIESKFVTVALLLSGGVKAFQPSFRLMAKKPPVLSTLKSSRPDLHEFDHIFDEGPLTEAATSASEVQIRLPVRPGERPVVLASSTTLTAPEAAVEESTEVSEEGDAFDPYGELTIQEQDTLKRYEEQGQVSQSSGFEDRLKQMDFQDVISTLILPAIFGGFAVKWGIQRVAAKIAGKTDETLDDFASELIYHDGDFEEMKLCFQDYSKKLSYLGPKKTPAMLKRYLQLYAKKKTVSPQSIR